jgi:hypothetical protein
MKKILVVPILVLSFLGTSALAETKPASATKPAKLTKDQEARLKGWQKDLDDKTVTENGWPEQMCGKKLPMTIDPSITPAFMEAGNEANFYCREVREKLSTMCRNAKGHIQKYGNGADNKALINKLISKIVCTLGTESEDQASFKIEGGTLTAFLGPKASNISENLIKYLYEKHAFNKLT